MNKYRQLTKRITKLAAIIVATLLVCGGLLAAASMHAQSSMEQKTSMESKFSQDNSLLGNLRTQLEKSGESQKRYAEIQLNRNSDDFTATIEDLREFLERSALQHGLNKANIKSSKEAASDKPELANFNYTVMLRQRYSISFKAVSDVHVYSFIDDLRRSAPGLVRIDKVEIKRDADLSEVFFSQIQTGTTPLLVDATIEFTWIRMVPKATEEKKADATQARNRLI